MDTFSRSGLTFDVTDAGPAGGRLVILLHGFPEDRHAWDGVIPALTAAGYRVLAPDQRGYSPGARPKGRSAYKVTELAADILALSDAAGASHFDVVGHDWGAAVAWALAGRFPHRVRTLTTLSVPHPEAFVRSMGRSSQLLHSWYMLFFQLPRLPELALTARGGQGLTWGLTRAGLDPEAARRYGARATTPAAMTGPVSWYRALPFSLGARVGPVEVPTLFVHGPGDAYITRAAAEGCAAWVRAPYRYEVIEGAGHWLPENNAGRVADLLLEHLAAN